MTTEIFLSPFRPMDTCNAVTRGSAVRDNSVLPSAQVTTISPIFLACQFATRSWCSA